MPSSVPDSIPEIINFMLFLKPNSILDIGAGAGKYGVLFREYLELCTYGPSERKRHIYIDAVEAYPSYIYELHHCIYDNIYVQTIEDCLNELGSYDLIFMGDLIEHFSKEEGLQLLFKLMSHANKAIAVVTPLSDIKQGPWFGNMLEIHKSHWKKRDFKKIARTYSIPANSQMIYVLSRDDSIYKYFNIWSRLKRALRGTFNRIIAFERQF
jgi:hypothetical protein